MDKVPNVKVTKAGKTYLAFGDTWGGITVRDALDEKVIRAAHESEWIRHGWTIERIDK